MSVATPFRRTARRCRAASSISPTMHRNETSIEKHASIPSYRVVRASIALLSVTYHTNSMCVATPLRRTARRCRAASPISATIHRNETSVEKYASTPSYRVVRTSIAPLSVTLHTNSMSRTARRCRAASSISPTAPQRNKCRKIRVDSFLQGRSGCPCCLLHTIPTACASQPRSGARLGVVVQRLPSLRQCTATKQVSKNTRRLLLTGSFGPRSPCRLLHYTPTACPSQPRSGAARPDNAPQRNKCRKTRIDSFLQGRLSLDHPVHTNSMSVATPLSRLGVVVQRLPSLRQYTATKQVSKNTHRLLLTGSFGLHPRSATARRCRAASSISPTMHQNETSVEKYASILSYRVVRASIAPLSVTLHTNSMSVATPFRRTARRCRAASSISPTMHRNETSIEKYASIPSYRVVRALIALLSVTYHTNSMSVATPFRRTARRCRAASSISPTMHRNETSVEKRASTPSYRVVRASIVPLSVTLHTNSMSVATPFRRTARRCRAASSISPTMHRNETSVEKYASIPSYRVVRASITLSFVTLHTNSMSVATPFRRTARRCRAASSISPTMHRNETSVEKYASILSYRVVRASIAPLSVTLHTNSMSVATPFRRTARRCRAASSISPTMHRNETSVEKRASIPSCRVARTPHCCVVCCTPTACLRQPRPSARFGVVVQRLPTLRQEPTRGQVSRRDLPPRTAERVCGLAQSRCRRAAP